MTERVNRKRKPYKSYLDGLRTLPRTTKWRLAKRLHEDITVQEGNNTVPNEIGNNIVQVI